MAKFDVNPERNDVLLLPEGNLNRGVLAATHPVKATSMCRCSSPGLKLLSQRLTDREGVVANPGLPPRRVRRVLDLLAAG